MEAQNHHPQAVASNGYSSTVEMTLHVGSTVYDVLQSGSDAIKVPDPTAIPDGDAILEISIDGRVRRHPISILGPASRPKWLAIQRRE